VHVIDRALASSIRIDRSIRGDDRIDAKVSLQLLHRSDPRAFQLCTHALEVKCVHRDEYTYTRTIDFGAARARACK